MPAPNHLSEIDHVRIDRHFQNRLLLQPAPHGPLFRGVEQRRSSIQVVELHYADGKLFCDRDAPTYIRLEPPM